jgi:hypothetical protein
MPVFDRPVADSQRSKLKLTELDLIKIVAKSREVVFGTDPLPHFVLLDNEMPLCNGHGYNPGSRSTSGGTQP